MNIFLTANMKTFEDFVALYSEGDEARANRGRSLFSYALGNSKAEERYKIVDFLLERNPSFAHKSGDGASLLHILLGAVKHDPARDAAIAQVLVDHGETFNCLDNRKRLPLQYLLPLHRYSDEDLAPIYDVVFASPDPGFDIELTGSHDTMYDVARRWPHRQALADRIARYLATGSEKHTKEHA